MPPAHAQRLAQHFNNTRLVWIDDGRTPIPIDQPKTLTDHLHTFLAAHTGREHSRRCTLTTSSTGQTRRAQ